MPLLERFRLRFRSDTSPAFSHRQGSLAVILTETYIPLLSILSLFRIEKTLLLQYKIELGGGSKYHERFQYTIIVYFPRV